MPVFKKSNAVAAGTGAGAGATEGAEPTDMPANILSVSFIPADTLAGALCGTIGVIATPPKAGDGCVYCGCTGGDVIALGVEAVDSVIPGPNKSKPSSCDKGDMPELTDGGP